MTADQFLKNIVFDIRHRFRGARSKAEETEAVAHNSYGAGYDRGYADALGELIEHLTGEDR